MNNKFIKSIAAPALAILCAFGMAAPAAFAADGTTATVNAGALTITNPAADNFADASITGVAQTTDAALEAFSVSDFTGSGDGWAVTAQAAQFTGANHSLALGSLEMSEPTVAANGTTSPDPSIIAGPYTLDGTNAAVVAIADTNEGMGTYDFSATTLTLALPANVFADVYASTITVSVVAAP